MERSNIPLVDMARLNLIAWDNHGGLSHDIHLLDQALKQGGHSIAVTPVGPKRHHGRGNALWQRLCALNRPLYDVNIMLEHIRPAFSWMANKTVFIPNPEWFSARDARLLSGIDAVFAKTQMATSMFQQLGCQTWHIGFTSQDPWLPNMSRHRQFLHLAGSSKMKGTDRLLAVWRQHPHWPRLTVIQSFDAAEPPVRCPNIDLNIVRLNQTELRRLQNSYRFHLCPSEAEGWGHYLVEAMACEAIVLTCDAPPMNDLVSSERGILLPARQQGLCNAVPRWHFDFAGLESAINQANDLTDQQIRQMGCAARNWYLENHSHFTHQLNHALSQLLS